MSDSDFNTVYTVTTPTFFLKLARYFIVVKESWYFLDLNKNIAFIFTTLKGINQTRNNTTNTDTTVKLQT